MSQMKRLLDVVGDLRSLADNLAGLADESKPLEESPEHKEQAIKQKITLEEVRKVLAEKSQAGHTASIRKLLHQHGANKLSDVKPEDYENLLREAEDLK